MWLITRTGIFSITQDPVQTTGSTMQIRSRWQQDLKMLQKMHPALRGRVIYKTALADYRYRLKCTRRELEAVMKEETQAIDYFNFKGAVERDGVSRVRLDLLHELWSLMARAAAIENQEGPPEAEF